MLVLVGAGAAGGAGDGEHRPTVEAKITSDHLIQACDLSTDTRESGPRIQSILT